MKNYFIGRKTFSYINKANSNLYKLEYEVRGLLNLRSSEIQESINKNGFSYPFKKISALNIGNPQAMNQSPLTFSREVIACFLSNFSQNKDAILRADLYKKYCDSGNYTNFLGINLIRRNVANFISNRDNSLDIRYKDVIMTNGAGRSIRCILESLMNSDRDAAMIPIPTFPLYPAALAILNKHSIGYELDEENGWSLKIEDIRINYRRAYDRGLIPKVFIIINPGNPTGNVLSKENIQDIVKFCFDNKMIIFADEVYQDNIYNEAYKFHSVRKITSQMHYPYNKTIVFSTHSTSKGIYGECGLRGGYLEGYNVPDLIWENIMKVKSYDICPNIIGQLSMDLLVNPPTLSNASQKTVSLYNQEVYKIYKELKEKSQLMSNILNTIPRFSCQNINGAMYAFPTVDIPSFRIEEAKAKNMNPDMLFALQLLEETGIVCVPGSGFGPKKGTYHIRLTNLLSPTSELEKLMLSLKEFTINYFKI